MDVIIIYSGAVHFSKRFRRKGLLAAVLLAVNSLKLINRCGNL